MVSHLKRCMLKLLPVGCKSGKSPKWVQEWLVQRFPVYESVHEVLMLGLELFGLENVKRTHIK